MHAECMERTDLCMKKMRGVYEECMEKNKKYMDSVWKNQVQVWMVYG